MSGLAIARRQGLRRPKSSLVPATPEILDHRRRCSLEDQCNVLLDRFAMKHQTSAFVAKVLMHICSVTFGLEFERDADDLYRMWCNGEIDIRDAEGASMRPSSFNPRK